MMKSILAIACIMFYCCSTAQPIHSNIGGRSSLHSASHEEGISAKSYVLDGCIALFDSIENAGWHKYDENATYWVDLVNGVKWNNMSPYQDGMRTSGANSCTPKIYNIASDFTLKGVLVNVNSSSWHNWTAFALARQTSAYHPGIGLKQDSNIFSVTYRAAYSGTILASVNTGTHYDEKYSVTIVFHYDALSFDVYVADQFIGSAQISNDDWVISPTESLVLGNMFFSLNYIGDFRLLNVMLYYRALSAEEIAYNWFVDQERYGL